MSFRALARAAGEAQAGHRRSLGDIFRASAGAGAGLLACRASSSTPCSSQESDVFSKFRELVATDGDALGRLRRVVGQDRDAFTRIAALVGQDEESAARLMQRVDRLWSTKLEDVDVGALISALQSAVPQSQEHIERLRVVQKLWEEMEIVHRLLDEHFGHVQWTDVDPLALGYLLIEKHRLRTPTWKAEHHRNHRGMLDLSLSEDSTLFAELVEHGNLAKAVYKRTPHEVRGDLAAIWGDAPWELPVCVCAAALGRPAHFLAVRPAQDESPPRVVLAIRGTREFADVLTDALMDSSSFEGGRAHSGVVRAATDLCEAYGGMLRQYEESGHDVLVVGHSLGAATAAATTLRLRKSLGLRRARCVGFAPPATLDATAAQDCAGYVTSVVHDDDFIPRSQVVSLLRLHQQLTEYDYVPVAKADVRDCLAALPEALKAVLPSDEIAAKVDAALDRRRAEWREAQPAAETDGIVPSCVDLLHVPGFVLHIYRTDASPGYGAARVWPEHLESLELSATMITDHLLTAHLAALQILKEAATQSAEEDVERAQLLLPLGMETGKEVVAAGVQLAQKVRHKVVAAMESRPDTS